MSAIEGRKTKNKKDLPQTLFMRFKYFSLWFFLVLFIDQLTKLVASRLGESVLNTGVSLSLFSNVHALVQTIIIAVIFLLLQVLFWDTWKKSISVHGSFSAAVVSNLVDRIFFGGVRDFLYLPVVHLKNNFADLVITASLCYLAYHLIREKRV